MILSFSCIFNQLILGPVPITLHFSFFIVLRTYCMGWPILSGGVPHISHFANNMCNTNPIESKWVSQVVPRTTRKRNILLTVGSLYPPLWSISTNCFYYLNPRCNFTGFELSERSSKTSASKLCILY